VTLLTRKPRQGSGGELLAGEALLVLGVVLGLAGLFPAYVGSHSLLSQWDQVVPHLVYVIGWAVTAALVALSVARPSRAGRLGALFGLGLSAVTMGLFLADLGQVTSGAALGFGLVVSLLGWGACTAGSALALIAHPGQDTAQASPAPAGAATPQAGAAGPPWQAQAMRPERKSRPVRPGFADAGPLTLLVLAAIGTAVAFAPSWDRYTIVSASSGTSQTVTAGNAFDNPGLVVAGNVLVMAVIVVVAALAALWRPSRHGGWLLAGAIVPLAAQAASAIIQAGTAPTPATFGISAAQAQAAGLTFTAGLTGIFWVYLVFVAALLISCAWLFTEPRHPVRPAFAASPWQPARQEQAAPGTEPGAGPGRGDAATDPGTGRSAAAGDPAAGRDAGPADGAAGDADAGPAAMDGPAAGPTGGPAGEAGSDQSRARAAGTGSEAVIPAASGLTGREGARGDSETGPADTNGYEDIDSAARDSGQGPEGEQSAYA
jgi:hypothetical protein